MTPFKLLIKTHLNHGVKTKALYGMETMIEEQEEVVLILTGNMRVALL